MYERELDLYDEDCDCIEKIALIAITLVETSHEQRHNGSTSVFDIRCHVLKHGDDKGQRLFSFDAKSNELAMEWMRAICDTSHSFILVPKEDGHGVTSLASDDHQTEVRKNAMMKKFQAFSMTPVLSSPADIDGGSPTGSGGSRPLSGGRAGRLRGGRGGRNIGAGRANSSFATDFLGTGGAAEK